jgi:hypothetical protein
MKTVPLGGAWYFVRTIQIDKKKGQGDHWLLYRMDDKGLESENLLRKRHGLKAQIQSPKGLFNLSNSNGVANPHHKNLFNPASRRPHPCTASRQCPFPAMPRGTPNEQPQQPYGVVIFYFYSLPTLDTDMIYYVDTSVQQAVDLAKDFEMTEFVG